MYKKRVNGNNSKNQIKRKEKVKKERVQKTDQDSPFPSHNNTDHNSEIRD